MATKGKVENDKHTGYAYVIQSKTELEEAKWLIEQGLFKDLDDYIKRSADAETEYIKYSDTQKKKRALARKRTTGIKEQRKAA